MKKLICLLLCFTMLFGLCACGDAAVEEEERDEEISREEEENESGEDVTDDDADEETFDDELTGEVPDLEEPEESKEPELSVEPEGPRFVSELLVPVGYSVEYMDRAVKYHYTNDGKIYAETADGELFDIRYIEPEDMTDVRDIESWTVDPVNGFYYTDSQGYVHYGDYIAHGIIGEILYAYEVYGKLRVYSYEEETGHIYTSEFESTGKMTRDNELMTFRITEQDGYHIEEIGTTESVESVEMVHFQSHKISRSTFLFKIQGNYYILDDQHMAVKNIMSVSINTALSPEEIENLFYMGNYDLCYRKDGVDDQLFFIKEGEEYAIILPEGYTVDDIKFMHRGSPDMLVFESGEVCLWNGTVSILGDYAEIHEEMSAIGSEIVDVFTIQGGAYLLMSDNVIYKLNSEF